VHVLPEPQDSVDRIPQPVVRATAAPPAARASPPPVDPFESDTSETPPEDEDPFGAMYELANQESAAPAQSNLVYCPQCRTAMVSGAVLCINCGYDTRTGKSAVVAGIPPAVARAPLSYAGKKAGKKIDYMAPTGSLVMGILYSGIAAMIASVLWIVVAWATGYAIVYIAILIGVAAGIGMQAGHKGQSQTGGFLAGCMTLVAIVFAKVVVLYAVMAKLGVHRSIWDLDSAKLAMYFFSPFGLIMIAIGIGAAYRTRAGR
jgi:hypothetical protein